MSVVIIGGNERMERKYIEICGEYKCKAKIFIKMTGTLKNKIGTPDILVLFTNTISHKMENCALSETKGGGVIVARAHSSSASALKDILKKHAG